MTQPDIYTVEARRRLAAVESDPGIAANILKGHSVCHYSDELAATLRELNWQPPVDPDLLEARKIVAAECRAGRHWPESDAEGVLLGRADEHSGMVAALAAIKRGRELERGE